MSVPANKGMILCSPHNPVGRVWTEQELKRIVEICKKYDKWIISDEIHFDLVRKGVKHQPLLKLCPEYKDRIIVCTAPSKTFNLAGMQLSNIVIPNPEYQKLWNAETGDKLHAYFPYTKDNSSNDAKNVALSIAAVQSQSEAGAFDIANLPMVSYPQRLDAESLSEIPALQMHVLGGILRAKVFADGQYGDEKVQSIAFADENTPMAGAFKLDLSGLSDEASLIVTGLASRTAKTQLSIPYAVPSSQESAKDIYMILAPGTYDGTLSVTTEKAVYTQPFQCEMKRNACYDASINLSTAARESIDGWNGEGTAEAP